MHRFASLAMWPKKKQTNEFVGDLHLLFFFVNHKKNKDDVEEKQQQQQQQQQH